MQDIKNRRLWIYDLAHENLCDDAIIKGFVKHYVLNGLTISNVQRDINSLSTYDENSCQRAIESLKRVLSELAEGEETRTLKEVQMIVDAVRAGERVQIAYYDPEIDGEYVTRACW